MKDSPGRLIEVRADAPPAELLVAGMLPALVDAARANSNATRSGAVTQRDTIRSETMRNGATR